MNAIDMLIRCTERQQNGSGVFIGSSEEYATHTGAERESLTIADHGIEGVLPIESGDMEGLA